MIIRPAKKADAAALADIWNPAIRDSLATFNCVEKSLHEIERMIEQKDAAGHGFFVAEENESQLGFAYYGQFRGGIGYAHTMENTIYLAPETKGRGVGRKLMNALENHAKGAGAHSMFAGVCAENLAGLAFHEAVGYTEVARLNEVGRKFNQWLDLVLLQKRI